MRTILSLALLALLLPAQGVVVRRRVTAAPPAGPTLTFGVSSASTTNATSYVTSSFTPAAGDLLLGMVISSGNTNTTPSLTESLGETTFAFLFSTTEASGNTIYFFAANAFTTTAGSRTVTFSSSTTASGAIVSVYRLSGVTRTGYAIVKQIAYQASQATGTTPTATFPLATTSTNPVLAIVSNASTGANTGITAPASFSTGSDNSYATPNIAAQTVFINSGFTGPALAWGGTSGFAFGDVAVELDASALPSMSVVQSCFASNYALNLTCGTTTATGTGTGGNGVVTPMRYLVPGLTMYVFVTQTGTVLNLSPGVSGAGCPASWTTIASTNTTNSYTLVKGTTQAGSCYTTATASSGSPNTTMAWFIVQGDTGTADGVGAALVSTQCGTACTGASYSTAHDGDLLLGFAYNSTTGTITVSTSPINWSGVYPFYTTQNMNGGPGGAFGANQATHGTTAMKWTAGTNLQNWNSVVLGVY